MARTLASLFPEAIQVSQTFVLGVPGIGEAVPNTVWNRVQHLVLVVPETAAPANIMQLHDASWGWVKRLTSAEESHQLILILVPLSGRSSAEIAGLKELLGLDGVFADDGLVVWSPIEPLGRLVSALKTTGKLNWEFISSKRQGDQSRRALFVLKHALLGNDLGEVTKSAHRVIEVFKDKLFRLDFYCVPGSENHPNGNRWRQWLGSVTDDVTPKSMQDGRNLLPTLNL